MLCGGLGGLGCFGGPISDWPREGKNTGEGAAPGRPSSGSPEDSSDEASEEDGQDFGADDGDDVPPMRPGDQGGKRDAGAAAPSTGGGSGRSDGGTTSIDAAVPTPTGESVPPDGGVDGGMGPVCSASSDGRDAGACYGDYCRMPAARLMSAADERGACSADRELALACDGELSRVVADCAQRSVFTIGAGRTIVQCARRAPSLSGVGQPCLDCYVDEMVCSMRSCLAPCLDGSPSECSACRHDKCGDAFLSCSGLPRPETIDALSPRGVDAGL